MKDVFAPNGGAFVEKLTEYLAGRGIELVPALDQKISVTEGFAEAVSSLHVHDHALVFEVAEALSDAPDIGLDFAASCDLRVGGLIGYAIRASATVGAALQTLARLSDVFMLAPPVNTPDAETAPEDLVGLSWDYGTQGKLNLRHWSEFSAALLLRNLRELSGAQLRPVSVDFMHAAPPSQTLAASALMAVPRYRAPVNRLVFRAQDLKHPLSSADPGLFCLLIEHANLIRESADPSGNPLSITVERLIMDGMADGEASLAGVAEALGISQRTLSRKLSAEGTSFFAILEGVRKSLSLRYLQQNEKTLSEISFLMGYSSLSSFNDAFRRWTGQSPGLYRNSHRKSA
ncbi:AraC family transcriptional regulator [Phaeobacter sp. HF9A]|uniref:AraC family transcriptional regulator n=1 Tax=Phaeobacter sp. HF9A TaxID=2721561 RepID=UPI00142FD746|nr:AraC family transcriptional regulator [Phaeobacter sp. HF9A]NIZ15153.1 AraC family transcriptional regulator [Phaeobacter sp. HF9A]